MLYATPYAIGSIFIPFAGMFGDKYGKRGYLLLIASVLMLISLLMILLEISI